MAKDEQNEVELDETAAETNAAAEASGQEEKPAESSGDYSDAGPSELDVIKEQLEQAQAQVAELKDQALRAQAESQNIRRRSDKDVENAHKFALDKFSAELLPVVDNLERALDSVDRQNEQVTAFVEGVELTRKSFLEVLKRFNIEQQDPVGEPFDPQLHEAMSMIEAPDAEPNTVLNVMQKGFTLNGRLIRAAMVVISKPAAKIDESA